MITVKKQTSKQETCKTVQWIEDERIEVEGNGASQCLTCFLFTCLFLRCCHHIESWPPLLLLFDTLW